MKTSTATLCSLALCFWGYQTGAWILAIPMALALEAREMIKQRWSLSLKHLQLIHAGAILLWLLSIFFLPPISPAAIPYAARYHLLKCLPVGLFPLILAQTYCSNFASVYRDFLGNFARSWQSINLYYPYFGICLLAASATGGNLLVFLAIAAGLVAGFLGSLRWPQSDRKLSLRFSQSTFYGLMALALILSIVGTHQFYWLQANVQLPGPALFGDFLQKVARIAPADDHQRFREMDAERLLEQIQRNANDAPTVNTRSQEGSQPSKDTGNTRNLESSQPTSPGNSNSTTATQRSEHTSNPSNSESPQNTNAPNGNGTTSFPGATQQPENTEDANDIDSPPTAREGETDTHHAEPPSDAHQSLENPETLTTPAPRSTQPPTHTGNPNNVASSSGNRQRPANPGQTNTSQSSQQTNQGAKEPNKGQSLPAIVQQSGGIVDPEKSQTQIGNIGSLQQSNAILFRVAPTTDLQSNSLGPTFPLYIREATYNQYNTGTWNAVNPKFISKRPQSNPRNWIFGPKTSSTTSVRISATLQQKEGLLKLPLGISAVNQLAVNAMQVNQYGTVAIQGKPGPLAYTVQFNPRQSLDRPPTALDREIPQAEKPTLQSILNSLDIDGQSAPETVQTISAFFKQGFQYSLELPQPKQNKTPLTAFLLDHRSGHCEYYASATALLLRAAGLPTRYAVGYTVHEYSPIEQQYIVRVQDAHAWVLAYVNNAWITVDTTPGSGISPNRNVHTETTQDGNLPPPKSFLEKLSEAWSSLMAQLSKHSDTLVWAGAMIVLGVAIVLFSIFLVWKMIRQKFSQRSRKMQRQGSKRSIQTTSDGLEPEFYLIEKRLGERGLERQPSETVRRWLGRLQLELPESQVNELHQIIDLHYRYRFDPQGLAQSDREQLKLMIQSWLDKFSQLQTLRGRRPSKSR